MCDICEIRCSAPCCVVDIPVHIADYCCHRSTVEVRCAKHPPTEPGWTTFDLAEDELFADEKDLREPEYATVYMRYVGDPQVLIEAAQRQNDRLGRLLDAINHPPIVYGVGEAGGICPNGPWYEREDGGDGA